ncbi:MAG: extracellular solute-binding protein, partial [Angelakisella sp.]
MKKTLATLLAATMIAGSFAGCGNSPASGAAPAPATSSAAPASEAKPAEPVTLTYWQHSSAARDEMMTNLVAEFEKQNPNIKVKLEFIPEKDYTQKLVPSLATATAPDVFQVQAGMASKLAAAGSIQPLDPSVIAYDKIATDFVPATVEGLKVNDKYYGMPTDVQTVLTFWNKKLVAEAGLDAEKGPQTWDEFYEWARKLTKKDASGNLAQSGGGG